jgi:hypothetical protein
MLTRFERPHNVTREKLKVMTRTFIAMFINTAIISLIVHAEWNDDSEVAEAREQNSNKFDDFTRDWY